MQRKINVYKSGKPYLQHVKENIKFNDGLSSNDMVQHGRIYIMHHQTTHYHNYASKYITYLGMLEDTLRTEK
jgi:predicted SprT family Zn-dependent metalloprotease